MKKYSFKGNWSIGIFASLAAVVYALVTKEINFTIVAATMLGVNSILAADIKEVME